MTALPVRAFYDNRITVVDDEYQKEKTNCSRGRMCCTRVCVYVYTASIFTRLINVADGGELLAKTTSHQEETSSTGNERVFSFERNDDFFILLELFIIFSFRQSNAYLIDLPAAGATRLMARN